MMKKSDIIIILVVAILFCGGCSEEHKIATLSLSGKNKSDRLQKIVLVQIAGNSKVEEVFVKRFERQLNRKGRTLRFKDKRKQHIKINIKKSSIPVIGETVGKDEIFLRIDIDNWKVKSIDDVAKNGNNSKIYTSNIKFYVTGVGQNDKKVFNRVPFGGSAIINESINSANEARLKSIDIAISDFIKQLVDLSKKYKIKFDDSADDMKKIIKMARSGKLKKAEKMLKKVIVNDKKRADAFYNLAVIYELEGRLRLALEYYNKALVNLDDNNNIYEKAKAECSKRFVIESLK